MPPQRLALAAVLLAAVAGGAAAAQGQPWVPLSNAAVPGLRMPTVGLGTGAYGFYWKNDSEVMQATKAWLLSGGERIDASFTYKDQVPVGQGMRASGLARESFFVTSKVGPQDPLGYNETLFQVSEILASLNTTYVDLLLIHWPGSIGGHGANSTDPACAGPASSPRACRQSTWRAMEAVFANGTGVARAIGVSNFEVHHLQDIEALGGLLPAVNQVEFHPYFHEDALLRYCKARNITFNGYSPLGAPDVSSSKHGWDLRTHPAILGIGQRLGRTAAQVILRYELQQGMVINPRTKDVEHMRQNLDVFDFSLDDSDVATLAGLTVPAGMQAKICPDPNNIP